MPRLSAEVIARSPAFINPLKERELDLRGNKIAVIENLAATQNQFDCIDLSDNEIRKVECLAVLPRVKMLLLNNNRVSRIAENLGRILPGLETLVLTNNQFTALKELEPLAGMPGLTHLSLLDNLVTKQANYRAFVVALLPNLRLLDYKKVKAEEREAAVALYAGQLRGQAAEEASNTFEPGEPAPKAPAPAPKAGPTSAQILAIKEAIANASSLEEVAKLEKALKSGNYEYITAHIEAQKGSENSMDTS